jgi:pimeloyl-ACP methyl ester carboxylesterase
MGHLDDLLSMTAFDMPGHGRSADWPGVEPVQHGVVAIAQSFLDEAQEPVDLIGHSFGGTAFLRLAAENPGRVRSLTLIEPPVYSALNEFAPDTARLQLEYDAPFAQAQSAGLREEAARHFTDGWGGPGGWAALDDRQRAYITDRIDLIEGAGQVLNADFIGLLRPGGLERVQVPVLLVRGDQSPPVIAPVAEYFAQRLPDASVNVIGGAGHMVPMTHPAEVASAIRGLLSRT